jgi:hypothetical protein
MNEDKPPIPLEFASPVEPRSFQDALTEFVAQEISDGGLKPLSQWKRILIWSIFVGVLLLVLPIVALIR